MFWYRVSQASGHPAQGKRQAGISVTQKHAVSHHLLMVSHWAEPYPWGGEILVNTTLLLSISPMTPPHRDHETELGNWGLLCKKENLGHQLSMFPMYFSQP